MEGALEQALEDMECVVGSAQQTPPQTENSSEQKSLYVKLYDIYVERGGQEPGDTEELRDIVNLLEKLVKKELLACLVVCLYPGKGGYSVKLKGEKGSSYLQTIKLPYTQEEFCNYLDAEELPPILADILEESQVNIFYWDCVVTEIWEYMWSGHLEIPGYQIRHVLLHTMMKTSGCDKQSKTSETQNRTQQDKHVRESQLLSTDAETLCLGPPISGADVTTGPMKRGIKRCYSPSLNGQEEMSLCRPFPELSPLSLLDKTDERGADEQHDLISKAGNCVDVWQQELCDLDITPKVNVEEYAQELKRSSENDDPHLGAWPLFDTDYDSAFEWESDNLLPTTGLASAALLGDPFISGRESSGKEVRGETQLSFFHSSKNKHSCSSSLESTHCGGKVFSGSKELVQKKLGGCSCQMCHGSSGPASLSQPPPGRDIEQPETVVAQASVLGEEVTQPSPGNTLSSSSGQSSSGNSLPQQASSSLQSPAPAPAQKCSVGGNQVNFLLATTLPSASSSQSAPATQTVPRCFSLNIGAGDHVGGDQAVVSGPRTAQGSSPLAGAPAKVKPSIPPSEVCPPNALPAALQPPSQVGVQFFLKSDPGLNHVTLLQPYTILLNTQQQPGQQQQRFYQLIPQQQLRQPSAPGPRQPAPPSASAPGPWQPAPPSSSDPGPWQPAPPSASAPGPQQPVPLGPSAQHSTTQTTASTTLLATVMDLHGAGQSLQPQRMLLLQVGPGQGTPGQSLPQQGPQQQVVWRILQRSTSVATVGTQTCQPPQGQEEHSQPKGKTTGDPPATPKS